MGDGEVKKKRNQVSSVKCARMQQADSKKVWEAMRVWRSPAEAVTTKRRLSGMDGMGMGGGEKDVWGLVVATGARNGYGSRILLEARWQEKVCKEETK